MARVPLLAFAALVMLTGCAQQAPVDQPGTIGSGMGGGGVGALGSLRPKADPAMIEKIRQESEAARQAQLAQMQQQAQDNQGGVGGMANATGQMLPSVGNTSISGGMPTAPPAADVNDGGPVVTPVEQKPAAAAPGIPFWPFNQAPAPPAEPQVASYGGYGGYGAGVPPPPPGASAPGGLVPPPPAVNVTGQLAAAAPYGGMPGVDPMNPYGANPYMQQPQQAAPAQRPALFGSGQRTTSGDEEDPAPKKKKDFTPIIPTGMESRSPYKQRDDLKVLWKSALAGSPTLQKMTAKDDKLAADLAKLDVGLPTEATKGSVSVSPRQIDTVFKPVAIDKKAAPLVKKIQTDLMQSYHRYLYSYNKWALAAQTVAARKQESEVASTQAEQQRAAADLASAQGVADDAKEEMRSAQYDLSTVVGPQGAATIIQRVSGTKPSVESLAMGQGDSAASAPAQADSGGGGLLGMAGGLLGFGKGQPKVAEAPKDKAEKKAKESKESKEPKGKKGGKPDGGQDLSPAPQIAAVPPTSAKEPADEPAASPQGSSSPISFELKNVNVTPRKSTLRVSIRNNGNESFSFDPDVISLSEGNRKLSEATVRAEFDATMVQPNQEVTGTITIYGRPWNDRLSVSLTDGGKTIQMRR